MYSYDIPKGKEADFAFARAENVNASFKDLAEVCGNIRSRNANWAVDLLEKAEKGEIPLRFRGHNKRMAHRRELGGRKGRWPKKCSRIVLKVLKSALANAQAKGLSEELVVEHACANKKNSYPRLAAKGRRSAQRFETARVEIVLKEKEGAKRPAIKPRAEVKKPEVKASAEKPKEAAKPEVKAPAPEVKKAPEAPKAEKPAEAKAPEAPKKVPKAEVKGEEPAERQEPGALEPKDSEAVLLERERLKATEAGKEEEEKKDAKKGKAQKPVRAPKPRERPKRRDPPKKM